MSDIEDIIKNHRSSFFDEDPPPGHMNRFHNKLPGNRWLLPLMKVAVVVVLLISITLALYYQNFDNELTLENISTELAETEKYYQSVLNKKLSQLEKILNDEQYRNVKSELKVMDKNYMYLKEDLKLNPNDQRIIHAMLNNYQLKIDLLQQVMDQIKINKNVNTSSYDTEQV